jgi:hypothetical protein
MVRNDLILVKLCGFVYRQSVRVYCYVISSVEKKEIASNLTNFVVKYFPLNFSRRFNSS